ncbi:DUF1552 domain-containing protein [Neorhodopirellula pilleata]|uniref:Secreted protein containing DUF1552 n=1 Tax=Neorhodopirellula pilleata TaxID=2714738 RepID=A0A5C6APQ3_9BACT|nr:DUF1552 domain-containing protein [Neorhodopirellula pilleata]TWU01975.1 hypothetical protein Pla100_17110 [Neorhodopirellula pilleata]
MSYHISRRRFLRQAGISAAAANFAWNLPSLGWGDSAVAKRQRMIFVFSPNGVIPQHFWPGESGKKDQANDEITKLDFKRILKPLEPFRDQTCTMHGLCNQIQGDGDGHMRGIGCLLTGVELFPGDIQGGSDTPAGWSQGISIDQFLKNQLQANSTTRTRFGSLEFGVMVPDRADTWTRMSYSGPNQPVAPIDDPYKMFDKLYGQAKNRELLASVLDDLTDDFRKLESMVSAEDRHLLQQHVDLVRKVERDLKVELETQADRIGHAVPELPPNIEDQNDNMPEITRMQIEMLVNGMAADFARVATFQITNSVGGAKMRWIGIDEGHHGLSHEPDSNEDAYEKLIKINTWYCEQVAYLAKRLKETPEPGGEGSMLDHTTIVWTNELGKGNSHTRDNIPFVLVGGGLGIQGDRAFDFGRTPHNRLLMTIAERMGFPQESFGNPDFCGDGVLTGLS